LRRRAALAVAIVAASLMPRPSAAQDCPTAQSARKGFVVERNERQKSEVFADDKGIVRTMMRYDGTTLLETTQFEGVFQLERIDRGKHTKFAPSTDLKTLFPLKPGKQARAKFVSEADGQDRRLSVELDVKGREDLYIGPCKYSVLRIERSESRSAVPPRFVSSDLYSPDLKLVLAREYRNRDGKTQLIKYDRIYPIKN